MRNRTLLRVVLVTLAVSGVVATGSAQTPPTTWRQSGYVKASRPNESDQFGSSIALSSDGSTMAVGVSMDGSARTGIVNGPNGNGINTGGANSPAGGYSSGAVIVYARTGNSWTQQAYIKASNAGANDQFGSAVTLSADGNTLAVAAVFEDSAATGINGNQADNGLEQSGAVYVFTRVGSAWTQQAYIKASNTGDKEDGDTFGYTIGLSGDGNTLAVGAPSEDSAATGINGNQLDNSASGSGAVYVFTRSGNAWSQQAYVKSSNARANFLFGYSVALNNNADTMAVGAFDEDGGKGALYMFARSGGTWSQQARLQASNAERQDSMGTWVTISDDGNTVAAGALDEDSLLSGVNPGDKGGADEPTDTSAGAAYVFVRTGNTWSQQAFIKASNPGKEDWFGVHLALSGDGNTLAVSSPNEDSAARGINGKQNDDGAQEAGAVYVYTRSGSTWSYQAYFKSSNSDQFDEFGSSVALSKDGKMMVVGARFEDSGAKGFNGNQADNGMSDSGAVYVFVR